MQILLVVFKIALFATIASAAPTSNKCNPCEKFCPPYLKDYPSGGITCPYKPTDEKYCDGVTPSGDVKTYLCGDYHLGPATLPDMVPVSNLVQSYDRLGGLCPADYLGNWTIGGSYQYPDVTGGYQADINCKPIKGTVKLQTGTMLDRFGAETGAYLSPKGAAYFERALPPVNLNNNRTMPKDHPNGYHIYEVIKEFEVYEGPIAPWFGQPGGGSQYELQKLAGGKDNSVELLCGNTTGGPYLKRLN